MNDPNRDIVHRPAKVGRPHPASPVAAEASHVDTRLRERWGVRLREQLHERTEILSALLLRQEVARQVAGRVLGARPAIRQAGDPAAEMSA